MKLQYVGYLPHYSFKGFKLSKSQSVSVDHYNQLVLSLLRFVIFLDQ